MKKTTLITLLITIALFIPAVAQVVHVKEGETAQSADGAVKLTLVGKKQNYSVAMKESLDGDINSPKSVNVSPDGKKFYVNSLEGGKTVVYDMKTFKKLKTISHNHTQAGSQHLWAPSSGLFEWHKEHKEPNTFMGKPVEGTFSHGGRYFWVPYYRRTYDLNAVEPSAMAVIDTQCDSIVRLFETGPLPKMVATSHDGKTLAVTHWGNNTVGLLNIEGNDPTKWHYTKILVVDYILPLNFGNRRVDRDTNSGYCLRGTVFTPDDRYIIVCCMGGSGGLAVIDVKEQKYLGRMTGMMSNVRHILINDGYIYLSVNASGYVQRIKLDEFMKAALAMTDNKGVIKDWENCKVGSGARTIELSPSGHFIFAACNNANQLCVVDTRTMTNILQIPCDSYPVGLDISNDGSTVIVTSQGRQGRGGNAVNIYHVDYAEPEPVKEVVMPVDSTAIAAAENLPAEESKIMKWSKSSTGMVTLGSLTALVVAAVAVGVTRRKKKNNN